MTIDDYVTYLEMQVNPLLVDKVQEWPTETKLYIYLHNIQLAHMAEFKSLLKEKLG